MTGHPEPSARDGAELLLSGAALAGARTAERRRARVQDWARDEASRLDDRIRALVDHQLGATIDAMEADLREQAARLLVSRGERGAAQRLRGAAPAARARLSSAGLVADDAMLTELLARLRQDLIAERLPVRAGNDDEPSLLVRLVDVADAAVSTAARGLMIAESRRREALAMEAVTQSELPAELHQQLVWRVAATLRDENGAALDRALTEAAGRALSGYDEGERADAQAMRLAIAIDARPRELAALLDEAIGDRRLSLLIAALALAAQLSFDQVRDLLIEPGDERWWLLLRAIDLDPLTIARVGLALAEADPRRAGEDLPALLDAANAVPPADARAALATLRLPADFRAAADALSSGAAA